MARTDYVQISRDDLEGWLNGLRWKWSRVQGRAGIYNIHFSPAVGVRLSSTIGTRDQGMGKGKASMNLTLISLITGHVLNRKARDRKYFQRTKNWMMTWAKGVDHWHGVYMKSQGFYDAIAAIEDRDKYKADLLKAIEAYPHWQQDRVLSDFHQRVEDGGVLTVKQKALLDRTLAKATPQEDGQTPALDDEVERKLQRLRDLYVAARRNQDQWTMRFAQSIAEQMKAGRTLSNRQNEMVVRKLQDYGLF
jgi:hypothetical protein